MTHPGSARLPAKVGLGSGSREHGKTSGSLTPIPNPCGRRYRTRAFATGDPFDGGFKVSCVGRVWLRSNPSTISFVDSLSRVAPGARCVRHRRSTRSRTRLRAANRVHAGLGKACVQTHAGEVVTTIAPSDRGSRQRRTRSTACLPATGESRRLQRPLRLGDGSRKPDHLLASIRSSHPAASSLSRWMTSSAFAAGSVARAASATESTKKPKSTCILAPRGSRAFPPIL